MNSAKFIHRNGRGSRQLNATPVHVAETKSFLTSCSLFLMELQEIDLEYSDASFGVVNNPEIMRAILCSEDCVYRERVVSCFGDNVVGLCAESS